MDATPDREPTNPGQSRGYWQAHAARLAELGYDVVPIVPGTKRPAGKGWVKRAYDPKPRTYSGHGVGVKGRATPGVDLDISDEGVQRQMVDWCLEHVGPAPRRIGRAPRSLLVYKAPDGGPEQLSNGKLKNDDRLIRRCRSFSFRSPDGETHQIEIIGAGAQYVAYAVHPDTGKPYEWIESELIDTPVDDLSEITREQVRALFDHFYSIVPKDWMREEQKAPEPSKPPLPRQAPHELQAPIHEIAAAVSAIPIHPEIYDRWLKVGMAIYHATGGSNEGFAIWDGWSQDGRKYDPDVMDAKWQSFGSAGGESALRGAKSLFREADDADKAAKARNPAHQPWRSKIVMPDLSETLWKLKQLKPKPKQLNGHAAPDRTPAEPAAPPLPPPAPPADENPFPAICRTLPGVLEELVQYLEQSSRRTVPAELLITTALSVIAYAAQNRYVTSHTGTSMQLYAAVVAKTGVGKTELLKASMRLFNSSTHLQDGIVERMASAAALRNHFNVRAKSIGSVFGSTIYLQMDELGSKLAAAREKAGPSHQKDLMVDVMGVFGRSDSRVGKSVYAKNADTLDAVDRPNLILTGYTTPDTLTAALRDADVTSGFLNRFLSCVVEDSAPLKLIDEDDDGASRTRVPAKLAEFVTKIGSRELLFSDAPLEELPLPPEQAALRALKDAFRQTVIRFERDAIRLLNEVVEASNRLTKTDATGPLWERAMQLTATVAGILSICEVDVELPDQPAPRIQRQDVEWAWAFVKWSLTNWVTMARDKIASDKNEAALNLVRSIIMAAREYGTGGKLAAKARFGNSDFRKECSEGWMPLSLLGRCLRGKNYLTLQQREQAITTLKQNGEIEAHPAPDEDGRGAGNVLTAWRYIG